MMDLYHTDDDDDDEEDLCVSVCVVHLCRTLNVLAMINEIGTSFLKQSMTTNQSNKLIRPNEH